MTEKISEESVPVQELKASTAMSLRRFVRSVVIVLLALFFICVGAILIYQLSSVDDMHAVTPVRDRVKTVSSEQRRSSPTIHRDDRVSPVFRSLRQQPGISSSVVSAQENPVTVPSIEEAPISPITTEINETYTEQPPQPTWAQSESKMVTTNTWPVLTLETALKLRDNLAMGQPCLDEFQAVIKNRLPDENMRDGLIKYLMPVCTAKSAFQELSTVFMEDKKEALMAYYRMTSSNRWVAYLKTIGSMLVDIRRLHPVKQKPKDIISQAQTALISNNVKQSVGYLEKLPPEIRVEFGAFLGVAHAYLAAQKETENLILSFEKKGGAL